MKITPREKRRHAKDFGGTASKAEKKICKSKNCKLYIKHNKTVIPKMKTKGKEKEKKKKKRKEKKQREKGYAWNRAGTFDSPGHVEDTKDYLSKFYY